MLILTFQLIICVYFIIYNARCHVVYNMNYLCVNTVDTVSCAQRFFLVSDI